MKSIILLILALPVAVFASNPYAGSWHGISDANPNSPIALFIMNNGTFSGLAVENNHNFKIIGFFNENANFTFVTEHIGCSSRGIAAFNAEGNLVFTGIMKCPNTSVGPYKAILSRDTN